MTSRRIINRHPKRGGAVWLAVLPFALLVAAYLIGSDIRLEANPNDKLLPPFSKIADAIDRLAFTPDKRSGNYLFWVDTGTSLIRLALGILIASTAGLAIGIATGLIPYARATLSPFIAVLSMIPPLAILPVLFIVFGLGELAKVVLIVFGVMPFFMRDMQLWVQSLPREQLTKAQTLGASSWQIALRVILPQTLPRMIDSIRLSLGPAWLFLIAAEAIASTEGLGYRIFLVRRYLSMDVILPYVAWITLLAFIMDYVLAWIGRKAFPWSKLTGS
ncbi:MAG: ABC transporter permease [Alphaproteobacteria bacterium]|jgi:NitT/TauT family transport system permease protein|nr:ABC transporter permease [Alphaproteobacteria bacterium]|tara:strand:- start:4284 stop:5108 length:825 start_codon:yes stop_codon:yes gene_type:complete